MLGAMLLGCVVAAAAQAPPQGQAQPPAGRGRGAPPPATRIVTFEAQPATIKPGESVLLVWHIENPPSATGFNGFGTLEPGVGRVAPRGSRRVTPAATTHTRYAEVVPTAASVASTAAAAAVAAPIAIRTTASPSASPVHQLPDAAKLLGIGTVLFGLAAAVRKAM